MRERSPEERRREIAIHGKTSFYEEIKEGIIYTWKTPFALTILWMNVIWTPQGVTPGRAPRATLTAVRQGARHVGRVVPRGFGRNASMSDRRVNDKTVAERIVGASAVTATVTLVGGVLMVGGQPASAATLVVDTLSDNPADGADVPRGPRCLGRR